MVGARKAWGLKGVVKLRVDSPFAVRRIIKTFVMHAFKVVEDFRVELCPVDIRWYC